MVLQEHRHNFVHVELAVEINATVQHKHISTSMYIWSSGQIYIGAWVNLKGLGLFGLFMLDISSLKYLHDM